MSDSDAVPELRSVVGERVRLLRELGGRSQDEVAHAVRRYGLKWTAARVSELENGHKSVGLAELIILGVALSDLGITAFGPGGLRLKSFVDIDGGSGEVRLTPTVVVERWRLAEYLSGGELRDLAATHWDLYDETAVLEEVVGGMAESTPRAERIAKLAGSRDKIRAVLLAELSAGLPEGRAARSLGVSKLDVVALSIGAWGRPFTMERDARAGEGATSRQKGWVTRDLVTELRQWHAEVMSDGERRAVRHEPG